MGKCVSKNNLQDAWKDYIKPKIDKKLDNPESGEPGQVLTKTENGVEWKDSQGGVPDWNANEGEEGFIKNKPFGILPSDVEISGQIVNGSTTLFWGNRDYIDNVVPDYAKSATIETDYDLFECLKTSNKNSIVIDGQEYILYKSGIVNITNSKVGIILSDSPEIINVSTAEEYMSFMTNSPDAMQFAVSIENHEKDGLIQSLVIVYPDYTRNSKIDFTFKFQEYGIHKIDPKFLPDMEGQGLPDIKATPENNQIVYYAPEKVECETAVKNEYSKELGYGVWTFEDELEDTSVIVDNIDDIETITKIILPDEIRKISDETFRYWTNLEEVKLPRWIETIGKNAFRKSGIRYIEGHFGSIDEDAFGQCERLSYVHCLDERCEVSKYAFRDCSNLKTFSCIDGEGYGRLSYIGEEAFSGCTNLIDISSIDYVIEDYAFFNTNLQVLNIRRRSDFSLKSIMEARSLHSIISNSYFDIYKSITSDGLDGQVNVDESEITIDDLKYIPSKLKIYVSNSDVEEMREKYPILKDRILPLYMEENDDSTQSDDTLYLSSLWGTITQEKFDEIKNAVIEKRNIVFRSENPDNDYYDSQLVTWASSDEDWLELTTDFCKYKISPYTLKVDEIRPDYQERNYFIGIEYIAPGHNMEMDVYYEIRDAIDRKKQIVLLGGEGINENQLLVNNAIFDENEGLELHTLKGTYKIDTSGYVTFEEFKASADIDDEAFGETLKRNFHIMHLGFGDGGDINSYTLALFYNGNPYNYFYIPYLNDFDIGGDNPRWEEEDGHGLVSNRHIKTMIDTEIEKLEKVPTGGEGEILTREDGNLTWTPKRKEWFGSMKEYEELGEYDEDTIYYIYEE